MKFRRELMKTTVQVFMILVLALLLCFQTVNACSIVVISLRKDFRKAHFVFSGEIVNKEKVSKENLPDKLKSDPYGYGDLDKLTFKISNSWKGIDKNQIVIYSFPYCVCPSRYSEFKPGDKFLVFADKNSFADSCNLHFYQIDKSPEFAEEAEKDMKRLNSFWFRTWARIYPF